MGWTLTTLVAYGHDCAHGSVHQADIYPEVGSEHNTGSMCYADDWLQTSSIIG